MTLPQGDYFSALDGEERYRLLAEMSRDVIACADPTGVLTYVSPACEEFFGYRPEEMVGRNWIDYIHADDLKRFQDEPPPPPESRPLRVSFRVRRADGSYVWMESFARIVTDPETGLPVQFVTSAREITERVASEDALRAQTAMYEGMLRAQSDLGEGCLIAEEQRFVYCNDAYLRLSGYTREELESLPSLLDLTTPEERVLIAERMERRARGEVVPDQYETEMVRKDGTCIDLEVAHRIVEYEDRKRFVTIVRDITERKSAEAELRESERRFAELYEREREATDRLRALDDMKNAFLAAVSHELRTPLTSILGMAHTLNDDDGRMKAHDRSEMAKRIVTNAEKLHRLLADLLDIDRARMGVLEPRRHPVDVAALARTTADEWMASSGRAARVFADEVIARLDGPKVERIIENLLSNAAKHTADDSRIWLRIDSGGGGVSIVVEDDGTGVSDAQKDAIFEPFVRGENAPQHAPGTGIGLALVTQFAELHGGRAWVEDREGGGASFHVFLPDEGDPT